MVRPRVMGGLLRRSGRWRSAASAVSATPNPLVPPPAVMVVAVCHTVHVLSMGKKKMKRVSNAQVLLVGK